MYLNRFNRKTDKNQHPIICALRKAGIIVKVISSPVDLLTYNPVTRIWLPLEVKMRKNRPRRDQEKQTAFIEQTKCPVVTTPEEALTIVLGERICGNGLQSRRSSLPFTGLPR